MESLLSGEKLVKTHAVHFLVTTALAKRPLITGPHSEHCGICVYTEVRGFLLNLVEERHQPSVQTSDFLAQIAQYSVKHFVGDTFQKLATSKLRNGS